MMNTDRSAVIVLLLRCYLSLALFLPNGIGKFANFEGAAASIVGGQKETILGAALALPLLYGFAYALPFIETLGGLALLLGWQTRRAFLVMSGLLLVLAFGAKLAGMAGPAATIPLYLGASLWGYLLADSDRYGISGWKLSKS